MTLKRGVENLIRHYVPEVTRIADDSANLAALLSAAQGLSMLITELGEERVKNPKDDLTTALVHNTVGEEMPDTGHGPRQWVIDPIDGTKNFVRGVPVWATLIALIDDGEPVVGVVSAPALNRRWWAAKGTGAFMGKSLASATRIRASNVSRIEDASLSYSSLEGWRERGNIRDFLELTSTVWRTRAYGDFWSYMMVAEGAVDIACEPELELYDMAALVPIVTEAGGRFTSLEGEDGPFGGNALATNGLLHPDALEALNPDLVGQTQA